MARQFGRTWWGRAWVDALENRARLDVNRLPRGRTYARHDRVSTLHLEAGEITAFVRGSRPGRYRVLVRVRTYGDDEWEQVVATIAGRAGHAAALLEGELDPSVAEDAAAAGVDLLPGPGDLRPRCSCPDWADPCKHAAAVCYLVADVLDEDPFALFALRGRDRDALLAQLRAHRRGEADDGPGAIGPRPTDEPDDHGEVAREVWRRWRERTPDDTGPRARVPVPDRPGAPAPWPSDPPRAAPFTAIGLDRLVRDAATRAWTQLRGEAGSALDLDAEEDLARRADARLARGQEVTSLANDAGTSAADLARDAAAWHHGGRDGMRILVADPWRPPVATMAAARDAVVESLSASARVHVNANRITAGPLQLRLDPDGRWWRFEKRRGRWDVTAPPAESPDDLLDLST